MFDCISTADGIPVFRSSRLQRKRPSPVERLVSWAPSLLTTTFRLTPDESSCIWTHGDQTFPMPMKSWNTEVTETQWSIWWTSFYGRGKQSVEQLRTLLNYHSIADREIEWRSNFTLILWTNSVWRWQRNASLRKRRLLMVRRNTNPPILYWPKYLQ